MLSKRIWFLIGLFTVVALAGCVAAPASNAVTVDGKPVVRQLNATGQGKVYLVPDVAYINIGVQSKAKAVTDALNTNNTQAQAIQKALTDLGVAAKDIQTSAFNVYPQQEVTAKGEPGELVFVVSNTVSVTVRDLSKLGALLDTVVRSGANTIHGISFDVQDKAKALSEARRLAIENAKTQAQELAQAAGVQLGDLQTLNVYINNQPSPVYDMARGAAMAESQVPVSSGQLLITAEASLTYFIK